MKNFSKALLLFVSTSSLFAHVNHVVEGRIAAFIHTPEKFRHIYGTTSADYQIEAMYRWCDWGFWGNFDWTSKCGRSIGFCNPTKVKIPNVSIGIKYLWDMNCWDSSFYLGLGGAFAKVKVRDESICGTTCCEKRAIGPVVKAGFYVPFRCHGVLDFFVDYVHQKAHFMSRADVGGVKIGIGLGGTF